MLIYSSYSILVHLCKIGGRIPFRSSSLVLLMELLKVGLSRTFIEHWELSPHHRVLIYISYSILVHLFKAGRIHFRSASLVLLMELLKVGLCRTFIEHWELSPHHKMFIYSSYSILVHLCKIGGRIPFRSSSLVLLTELLKVGLSFTFIDHWELSTHHKVLIYSFLFHTCAPV